MYQTVEDKEKKQGTPCHAVCFWILQIITWAEVVCLIVFLVKMGDTSDSKTSNSDSETIIVIVLAGITYLAYIITMFCSPTCKYLAHKKDGEKMYDKMKVLFKTAPVITFSAQCYHYETRYDAYRDNLGHIKTREIKEKVPTHFETMNLPYYSAKDVSGLFLLDIDKAAQAKKAYIKLNLKKEINFADAISYMDYTIQKEAFWRRNRYRDVHMDFTESRNIPGIVEYNLIQISDYSPPCVNLCIYILLTFLTFAQPYKSYVDSLCVPQKYKIRKIVSTRYNLLEPQYVQQYQSITPALNINDQMYSYDASDTGYCYSSANINVPTEEELQKAQQYSSQVPNYGITSVGGEINGVQVGVVQDIPQFNECNYNEPPPSFASMGGNVALTQEQLKQEGNNYASAPPNGPDGNQMPIQSSTDQGFQSGGLMEQY